MLKWLVVETEITKLYYYTLLLALPHSISTLYSYRTLYISGGLVVVVFDCTNGGLANSSGLELKGRVKGIQEDDDDREIP